MPSNSSFFQACLEECIRGIESFPVDRYLSSSASPSATPRIGSQKHTPTVTERDPYFATEIVPTSPRSPVLSTSRPKPCKQAGSPPPVQKLAGMERSRWAPKPPVAPSGMASSASSKAPLRVPSGAASLAAPSAIASQKVPANLAVQPVETPSTLKLKKSAVKMVGTVGQQHATSTQHAPSPVVTISSPVAGASKVEPKTMELPIAASPVSEMPSFQSLKQNDKSSDPDLLGNLFARLNVRTSSLLSVAASDSSVSDEKRDITLAEGCSGPTNAELTGSTVSKESIPTKPVADKKDFVKPSQGSEEFTDFMQLRLENEFLRKASAFIDALPDASGGTPQLIKVVSRKLRNTYTPAVDMDQEIVEALKARFAFAIATYLKVLGKGPKPPTAESIKQTLKDIDGDFLKFCSILVDEKYISLETLDDVTGLVKNILNILPKAEPSVQENETEANQPVINMKGWPSQTMRDNRYRTCMLKGVAVVTSINQLQALVWGGKLESISMPELGSSTALVRFLTADGCKKYFEDTMNGIEVVGDKKNAVVYVELAEGPNSINDVIQSCIDRDITRCVRATGEVKFTNAQLFELAQGKGQSNKREVDRIKRGRNSRGYEYVEFRFANVYHALNFKRELGDDEDWEHCNVVSAPDPCELATGVHYDD